MRIVTTAFLLLLCLAAGQARAAGDCRGSSAELERTVQASRDPDARSRAGTCLVRYHLGRERVAQLVLGILRDSREDLLLREDLVEALGDAPLRKKVRVDGTLGPSLGEQDKVAVERTLASANQLLELTQAVKSMEETMPVTSYESELVRALSEIALDDGSHVLLKELAVSSLEKISKRIVDSGIYDEKVLRLSRETLRTVATREDNGSYYSGAGLVYGRLAAAGLPGFNRLTLDPTPSSRMLSSVKPVEVK